MWSNYKSECYSLLLSIQMQRQKQTNRTHLFKSYSDMHRLLQSSSWSTFSFDYDPLLLWRYLDKSLHPPPLYPTHPLLQSWIFVLLSKLKPLSPISLTFLWLQSCLIPFTWVLVIFCMWTRANLHHQTQPWVKLLLFLSALPSDDKMVKPILIHLAKCDPVSSYEDALWSLTKSSQVCIHVHTQRPQHQDKCYI